MNKQLELWDWYNKESVKFNYGSLEQYEWAQKGWQAARDSILEILKNQNNQIYMGRHTLGGFGQKIKLEVIEQIEKL